MAKIFAKSSASGLIVLLKEGEVDISVCIEPLPSVTIVENVEMSVDFETIAVVVSGDLLIGDSVVSIVCSDILMTMLLIVVSSNMSGVVSVLVLIFVVEEESSSKIIVSGEILSCLSTGGSIVVSLALEKILVVSLVGEVIVESILVVPIVTSVILELKLLSVVTSNILIGIVLIS